MRGVLCCPRCREFYAKWFAQKHPDIVGSSRVITRAMVQRAIDEMRARNPGSRGRGGRAQRGRPCAGSGPDDPHQPDANDKSTPGGAADRRLRL